MTVGQLIDHLKVVDADLEVYVWNDDYGYSVPAESLKLVRAGDRTIGVEISEYARRFYDRT